MKFQADYLDNLYSFLKGVNKFYGHFETRKDNQHVIWQEGSTRVIDYTSSQTRGKTLFFIPSLINKSYILDLTEKTSIVKYFASLGYKVYLVDFIEPLDSETNMKLSDYEERLSRAISELCVASETIVIGYCLGGVLALNLAEKFDLLGQILLATPWDFKHFKKHFALDNQFTLQNFINMIEQLPKTPASMVQLFFSYLAPERIWYKFCQFSGMKEQNEIDNFLALEQWVNDGLSLSRAFALESLQMLANNSLNKPINCSIPTLAIYGLDDKIVPASSCLPLYQQLSNKFILFEKTGHVGLIIGKVSQSKIWPEMAGWLETIGKNNG